MCVPRVLVPDEGESITNWRKGRLRIAAKPVDAMSGLAEMAWIRLDNHILR